MSAILRRGPGAHENGEHPVIEAELEQFAHEARRMAAGGWRRAAIGFLLGAGAGLLAALVLPREEGPRRTATGRPTPLDG